MSEIVATLIQWLNDHPQLAGLFTFIISAAESVAIIGTIVPGSIMMSAIGALAGAGVIPIGPIIVWAILGAVVGDGISYWVGYYFKERLHRIWPFRTHPTMLKTGELFFHKYGGMSVFIGRFVGPVRALVPLVAGMFGMKPWKFIIANVISAIGWAPAYMLPGILLGAASQELPPDIAMHVILVLFLILLFILLCLWFIYKSFKLVHNQTNQLQNKIWVKLKNSRYFAAIPYLLKHHDPNQEHGQFGLALLFLFISLIFLIMIGCVIYVAPMNILSNDTMFHLFRGLSIRSDHLTRHMIGITLLGQKQVVLPVVAIIAAWLFIVKRPRAAIHTLLAVFLAVGSVFTIKNIIRIERPWGVFHNPETFSMPSGHTTLATVCYVGLAFLIAYGMPPSRRWIFYAMGVFLAFIVGISRLYLGVHWFTDILSAWLLGAALLTFVIISFQRKYESPTFPAALFLITVASMFMSFSIYRYYAIEQLEIDYAQVSWPRKAVQINDFWRRNRSLPAYHTSLFGYPSQLINIEWVGNIDQIKETLLNQGWAKPPARDLVSTLHRIADISSSEYLPLVSPQYLDKRPALILTRMLNNKTMLVIRLWDSHRYMKEDKTTLWVGYVGIIPRSYNWLYKNGGGVDVFIDPIVVFPNKTLPVPFEYKIMTINMTAGKKRNISQRILLIKPKSITPQNLNEGRPAVSSG